MPPPTRRRFRENVRAVLQHAIVEEVDVPVGRVRPQATWFLASWQLVVLHSIEEEAGVRFLTMELVEGESLDRHIEPGGLPIARLMELGIAIADALAAAYALSEGAGVVVDHPMDPGVVDRIEALKASIPKADLDGILANASTLSPAEVLTLIGE